MADRAYAFVTPYHREDRHVIERCLKSVRDQGSQADHILVADGYPAPWLDSEPVRHVKLDRAHGDFGNTPRGLGALLAICEDYDGIGFLDADNWLEKDHLSRCLEAAAQVADCDFVIARRHFRRPDGTIIDIADEPVSEHVDTSCFFFLPGSFHIIPHFAMMPRALSFVGDRVFYSALRRARLNAAVVPTKTVNYHCLWQSIYALIGETPPDGAKPNIDPSPSHRWLRQQGPRALEIAGRRAGVIFEREVPGQAGRENLAAGQIGRNQPCPCGSGRKFKHCHGRRA